MTDKKIENTFKKIKLPTQIKGYTYLKDAIKIVLNNTNENINNIYNTLAEKYNTSNICIEKAIKHAIYVILNNENNNLKINNFRNDENLNKNFINYFIKEYNF